MLGGSQKFTDGQVIGSDEGINLQLFSREVLGTLLGDVDGITLGIDVGTDLCSLDLSFDSFNDGKL